MMTGNTFFVLILTAGCICGTAARCSIETIDNGGVTDLTGRPFTQDASHGDWRQFTCEQGYTMVGSEKSQCVLGEWNVEKPFCREDPCPAVANKGEYSNIYYQGRLSDEPSFPANTFLEVDCAEGRVTEGTRTSVCRKGSWDPPRILCVEAVACDEVPEEAGRNIAYSDNSGEQKQHKSSIHATCDEEKVRFGPDTSICLNGLWDPPVAHCRENLALRRHAYQDSTHYSGVASRGVDGNTNGFYNIGQSCTHTGRNLRNHWWYVDLGSPKLVQEIIIYTRQDSDLHTRLLDAKVRVGRHYGSNVLHNELVHTVIETRSNPIRIHLNPAIEGRFVSVSKLRSAQPLTLCEVQVFGKPRACPSGCQLPHLENGYFTLQSDHQAERLQPMQCVSSHSHVYIHCRRGMFKRPSTQYWYRCEPSELWYTPEGVFSSCERCPNRECVVPYIKNGQYSLRQGGSAVTSGTCLRNRGFLYLACHDGEPPIGRSLHFCNNGELWTPNDDNNLSTCSRGPLICSMPERDNHVEMFVGDNYIPVTRQDSFTEGDFITSRCQNPRIQTFSGSVIRRCEGGQWNGNPAHCESTNIHMYVSNTVLQGIDEDGTIVVFAVTGHIKIHCQSPGSSSLSMFKDNVPLQSISKNRQGNHRVVRIDNPSTTDSGTYRCDRNGQSHSISIIFEVITCPTPQNPEGGQWLHHRAPDNRDGLLGYIFTETLSLNCNEGYRPIDGTSNPTCTHHGTWSNISQQRCIPI